MSSNEDSEVTTESEGFELRVRGALNTFFLPHPDVTEVNIEVEKLDEDTYEVSFDINGFYPHTASENLQEMFNSKSAWHSFFAHAMTHVPPGWYLRENEDNQFIFGDFIIIRPTEGFSKRDLKMELSHTDTSSLASMVSMSGTYRTVSEMSAGPGNWRYQGVNRFKTQGQCLVALTDGSTFTYYRTTNAYPGDAYHLNVEIGQLVRKMGQIAAEERIQMLMKAGAVIIAGTESAINPAPWWRRSISLYTWKQWNVLVGVFDD